jgi:hypothetical protein
VSARDDEAVARMARTRGGGVTREEA